MIDNKQKYYNYKEQMGRLSKALNACFYIEAIAIEYAIIEDRIESVLRHSGRFNKEKHTNMVKKLKVVSTIQSEKVGGKGKVLLRKYLSDELIESIYLWKDERNKIIHALLNQNLETESLSELAQQGRDIVKALNSKVSSYNRALEKLNIKENNNE